MDELARLIMARDDTEPLKMVTNAFILASIVAATPSEATAAAAAAAAATAAIRTMMSITSQSIAPTGQTIEQAYLASISSYLGIAKTDPADLLTTLTLIDTVVNTPPTSIATDSAASAASAAAAAAAAAAASDASAVPAALLAAALVDADAAEATKERAAAAAAEAEEAEAAKAAAIAEVSALINADIDTIFAREDFILKKQLVDETPNPHYIRAERLADLHKKIKAEIQAELMTEKYDIAKIKNNWSRFISELKTTTVAILVVQANNNSPDDRAKQFLTKIQNPGATGGRRTLRKQRALK